MILFTIYDLFTMNMMGMGEKLRNIQNENQGKNSAFGYPPILPSMKMKTDCFPVSENTENKPDLP